MASVKKLQDYIRRSSGDVTNLQNVANRTGMTPAIRKHIAKRNAGQLIAQRKLSEDASSAITDSGDRRQYNSLRAMQSDRLAKAKKAKDTVAQGHHRMAQQHADAAEAILDKYRKESSDMCKVCGQTPCNCTTISEAAVDDNRMTLIKRAIARAQRKVPVNEITMSDDDYKSNVDSYGKRATNLLKHSWASHDASKEKAKAGDKAGAEKLSATGSRAHKLFLKAKQKHLQNPEHAEASRKKIMSGATQDYKDQEAKRGVGHVRDSVELEGNLVSESNPYIQEGLVDESSDKLYGGYQADVLSLKAKAAAQEKKHPVDIQKLAARMRAVTLKTQGKK